VTGLLLFEATMNQSLIELRKKPHTSISAVREFMTCPRKFFFHYVEKRVPEFRPAALAFGSAWHETIGEWLTKPVEEVQPEQLREHLRDGIVNRLNDDGANVLFDDADQDEGSLVDTALRMLDAFLAQVPRPEKTLAVEAAFSLELNHPQTGEVLPVPLIGAMDAVVLAGGVGSVWELKTAAKKWSAEQLEHDLQITAYKIAARELGYDGVRLEFLVVTKTAKASVQREVAVRHKADERELVDVIFSVHRAIRAGVDHRARSWACAACPYAGACRR
jgi:CRISPR/Cas system-associated exonuclease Cas4 (RecB family)